jgi:hypothetical protein
VLLKKIQWQKSFYCSWAYSLVSLIL